MKPVEIEFLMRGNLHRGLGQAQQQAVQLDGILRRVGATVGIAFGTAQAVDFAHKIMDVRGEMESLQMSFETLAGASKGNKLFSDIKEFATNTPMMMQDLAKGAQTLLAFNTEAENVMPILRQIGDISMGDAQKFNSLVLAFSQMSSTGKLMGQDLLQMINAGFNPLVVISEKTGKSMERLKDDMSKGKITVDMVADAFATATAEGGKFHGMLEKQSKGVQGAMSNLQGAWENSLNDIGEKTQGVMMDGIELATLLVKNYEQVLDVLAGIAVAYGTYKAALMACVTIEKARNMADMIRLVMMYRKEMGLLTAAQKAFNLAALRNPYVMIAAALAGAAVAVYKLATADNAAEAAQKDLNKTVEKGAKALNDHQEELDRLTSTANDEAASTTARSDAMQQLIDKYPNIIKKYIDEKGHLKDILQLKHEIAMLDGSETAKSLAEKREKAQRYLTLYKRRFQGLSQEEWTEYSRLKKEVWDQQGFWTKAGYGWGDDKFVRDFYQGQLPGLKKAAARANTENVLREFNFGLTEKTDQELEAMLKVARSSLDRLNQKTIAAKDALTNDYLTEGDWMERISTISGILDKRHPKKPETPAKPTKGKTALETETERKQKEADAQVELDKYTRNMVLATRQSELEIRQSRLDAQEEGLTKEVEQIRINYDKLQLANEQRREQMVEQMKAAERKQWEKDTPNAAKEGKVFTSRITADDLTAEQKRILSEYEKAAEQYKESATASAVKDITSQYIRDYGDYQQQRELIIREGNEKISRLMRDYEQAEDANVRTAIRMQANGARKEMEKGISELDFKHLKDSIDWETVFNDIDKVSTGYLQDLKTKLKTALDTKDITAENAKVLSEKIREIEDRITVRTDFLTQLLPGLRERKRLTEEAAQAEDAYRKAIAKEGDAMNKVIATKKEIKAALDSVDIRDALGQRITIELEAISEENKENLLQNIDKGSELYKALLRLFENLAEDNEDLKETQATTQSRKARAETVNDSLLRLKGGWSDWFNTGDGTFTEIFQSVNQNVQSLNDLADTLGVADTDFGRFVGDFAESSQHFTDAISKLASGDVIGALDSVINGFASLGEAIGGVFGLGGADYSAYNAMKERFDALNEVWDEILQKKRSYISLSWGIEAQRAGDEALALLDTERRMNALLGEQRLDSGSSTGSHSIWYRMWKGSYKGDITNDKGVTNDGQRRGGIMWRDVNEAVMRGLSSAGLGNVDFYGMGDMLNMTGEQLEWIRENYTGLWVAMDGEFRECLENIIQYGETESEILERIRTQVLGTSFDSMFDNWMQNLQNIKDGTDSVTEAIEEDFEEMMNVSAIKSIMGETYKKRMREWYDQWYASWEEGKGLNQSEIARLKEGYMNITNDAMRELEALREAGILQDMEQAYSQSGRSGSFNAMSQEQGTKLEGMFTSGLRHWVSIDEETESVVSVLGDAIDKLEEIADNTKESKGLQKDIKELIDKIIRDGIKMK
ncbi:MAG: tape measure protein [Prevotella sp.]|nr:tape measure protein [Prevotella sp.]